MHNKALQPPPPVAQFIELRHNCATTLSNGANTAMSSSTDLLNNIQQSVTEHVPEHE
jgi:hypothetical protein